LVRRGLINKGANAMHINFLAVIAAAIAAFAAGAVWYSPLLFVKPWRKELGIDPDAKADFKAMAPQLVITLVLSVVQAGVFAMFLGKVTPMMGAAYGFLAGLCWVAAAIAIIYLYEQRSFRLLLINGGFNVVVFTLYGLILGLWP
jgi:hypothetical protein